VTSPLDRVWALLAERLQRNGLRASGRLTVDSLTRDERHALAGLLGRPVSAERATIDLAALDGRLRATGRVGLVALVEHEAGALVDRPGARAARQSERDAIWSTGRAQIAASVLDGQSWIEPWLDDIRRAGALGRLTPERATATLVAGVHCLASLPVVTGGEPVARGDLASLVTGNAHALDDGSVLASLVLRAAAVIVGEPYRRGAGPRRELWQAVGVQIDEVSTTALTIGLRSQFGGTWLDLRTASGWETHLSARDLRRVELRPPANRKVFVCENPRVLELAIDRGTTAAAVCTHGQPAIVVLATLDQLRSAGAELWYHGDFDWPGLSIAQHMIGVHGCRPWRMAASDYLDALASLAPLASELPALEGPAVLAGWDHELTAEMSRANRTIHEELLLNDLLADMS
jgi:uncharacterized protein (TIGR02679 family)